MSKSRYPDVIGPISSLLRSTAIYGMHCCSLSVAYLVVAAVFPSAGAAAVTLPLGNWRIQAVHVDSQRTGRMIVQPDDPTLVGRAITSTTDTLTLDNGSDATGANVCRGASVTGQTDTLSGLLGATMGARPDGAPKPIAADYGLHLDGQLQVLWVACRDGRFGPSDFAPHPGAWIVQDKHGNLLIGWSDATVLSATPVQAADTASPSFDCHAAQSVSEHAICGSPDLANADRSVASAYRNAKEWCDNDPSKLKALSKVQADWRRQRDKCGAGTACLKRSMEAQTAKLNAPGRFLGD